MTKNSSSTKSLAKAPKVKSVPFSESKAAKKTEATPSLSAALASIDKLLKLLGDHCKVCP